jgi:hypothetical protein
MGHYAAEMQCDKCGNLRCTCPPPPDKTQNHWVVGDGYTVLQAQAYQDSCGHGQLAFFSCMMKKHYKKCEDAQEAARVACEAALEHTRQQLTKLKKTLKVERPWEQ